MLELKNITYQPQTGNKKILDSVSFNLNKNEVILICGNSGSGKTTLLEIISGLIKQQEGEIFWNSKKVSARQRRWLSGIVFQFPERFFVGTTVGKELKFGHKTIKQNDIESVLHKVGLSDIKLTSQPEFLSGGQQRRLAVATQLLRSPNLLLLDEPTAGLDWSMKNDVRKLIHNLRSENTILIVTHEPNLFQDLPSKILTLNRGKIEFL